MAAPSLGASECTHYVRQGWKADLASRSLRSTGRFAGQPKRICGALPEVPAANVLLRIKRKGQSFERRLNVALDIHFDHQDEQGTQGGVVSAKTVWFDSLVPVWTQAGAEAGAAAGAEVELLRLPSLELLARGVP